MPEGWRATLKPTKPIWLTAIKNAETIWTDVEILVRGPWRISRDSFSLLASIKLTLWRILSDRNYYELASCFGLKKKSG